MSVESRSPAWLRPQPVPSGMMPDLPENRSYKFKRFLLGPPLVSERLQSERLGEPVALAVLSSDVMSSSAGPGRNRRLVVAISAFACSAVVTLIFVVTEFTGGAWLVVVVIPVLVATLSWTHRRYQAEKAVLAEDAAAATSEVQTLSYADHPRPPAGDRSCGSSPRRHAPYRPFPLPPDG